jgi:hypothetical protein
MDKTEGFHVSRQLAELSHPVYDLVVGCHCYSQPPWHQLAADSLVVVDESLGQPFRNDTSWDRGESANQDASDSA